ncbi:MAG: hypothetical protein MJY56_03830 [Bacteroidales bacterium]|nr:hypothetical protein [Bacteroidales bacterium]
MENKLSFRDKENICLMEFERSGSVYHLCTPENHPVIFTREKDFAAAMSLLAIAFAKYPGLKVYAFEIMSNHIHILVGGEESLCLEAFALFKKFLKRYLSGEGRPGGLPDFEARPHRVKDLENMRNVIAYINRNAYVAMPDHTPYSYPWGTGRFYFNPEAVLRHEKEQKPSTVAFRRHVTHSRHGEPLKNLTLVDGCITPICFCDFSQGERFFRDARHYFTKITRSIEYSKAIADEIGESIYYTDDELYLAMVALAKSTYDSAKPSLLPAKQKLELAKTLHYEYNAGNKQISRMLGLDISTVDSLFLKH